MSSSSDASGSRLCGKRRINDMSLSSVEESEAREVSGQETEQTTLSESAKRRITNGMLLQHGFTRSIREDEEEYTEHINDELLIKLVEARPPLWDQSDPLHKNHIETQHLWEEVYSEIVNTWDDLSSVTKKKCGEKILTRWRAIHDHFLIDQYREQQEPNGLTPSSEHADRYRGMLHFLRMSAEIKQTTSSSREPGIPADMICEHEPTAVPAIYCTPAQETTDPLPESSSTLIHQSATTASFGEFTRERSGGRDPDKWVDLANHTFDALLKLNEEMTSFKEEVLCHIHQLEGAWASNETPFSANHLFLQTLVPWMDQMTPEQMCECRIMLTRRVLDILHHPPMQSYSPSQSFFSGQSYASSQSYTPYSRPSRGAFSSTSTPASHFPFPTSSTPRSHNLSSFSEYYCLQTPHPTTPFELPRSQESFSSARPEECLEDREVMRLYHTSSPPTVYRQL